MSVSLGELTRVFARIGLLSFGGPAAQIALMHRELVEERNWLSEEEYLRALSFCMLLPGPEAMQLATYAGWKLRGTPGGLIAGLLFVVPGALVILALATAYAIWGSAAEAQALLLGVKAAVLGIVLHALQRVAKRALRGPGDLAIAVLAFIALFLLNIPFPAIIVAAALWGWIEARGQAALAVNIPTPPPAKTVRTIALWLAVWLVPLAALALSGHGILFDLGVYFSKLAVVTFGGAYAVLGWMTQSVVQDHGWITQAQMIDALGLAETTPGPLILVTAFVGYLAAEAKGGIPLGVAGWAVTLWMTFAPCFLWIFAGAPWLEHLTRRPALKGALAAITAAVVGVIASISVWFGVHVLFGTVNDMQIGPLHLPLPDPASLHPEALVLGLLAGGAILWRHWPLPLVLILSAGLSWAWAQI
ncbi:chromate efflux transporter [Tabrizicola sp. J26]|uniref:chromate efflux transporter n=1 Tax=Alitabrizicola rongguiensis TaxID=2909234 RepID=UPI001F1D93F6|nr:chromate efflux transporter [Tabrizicola rongguiensis]MCF1710238.1 chromate efflux transporter [Tabrizicola rongguiensis]